MVDRMCIRTLLDETTITEPKGTNTKPITKKVVMTGMGVRRGWQARNLCCLKLESRKKVNYYRFDSHHIYQYSLLFRCCSVN